ncbi:MULTISPECIES: phosphoribosylformylglycinamidine synthase subunit PurL [unclassified Cryobacterium]|uniref:phosphoribosylformylglycinamidine synthase subunit PurL n=1 Tax=unclassified Cryobacterium TaxID=2649013 RepID=UPI00106B706E|nr:MULTISPECIES: phosphoribosylformylglycinamidine synthase subunit PurL [unclassified Cryobacterium]TFB93757.1 phosphoribosylformylglycinamidine synthase subunit PurL [Cryobacterium sp. MDB2-A-1]TFC09031.1 phosphoribosylformylglycinamidine synthase subunit PurL [Cryobacterium sp. MDB2-33-2]TFC14811.1 phosphoribosylformylglycinamidine synthase subunit PurL [Cryobacterium sp. MDB2-A-2]TFC16578.1 phosphoribosylformylglycinamidine synthase subunit PurL [Cryobacterium sp. MDB2-10]
MTAVTTTPSRGIADTVANAIATPDKDQPFGALGLTEGEYQEIRTILGRRPTSGELAMYSVMWSEHCSYKSSKKYLRQFGDKVSPAMKKNLMVGMGENAGVLDVGEGWAVTFKIESHNHPSYIEPFQGAATGVGGIVRDIISMGARPVAVMDALRFGRIDDPDTARVVHGVVSGISFYGNCLGLPNIGGETWFDSVYQGNPLVNALSVGVLRHEDLHLANARGVGNKVVLFGARTGGDGIGGASILASDTFSADGPTKRPAVQVGDPFAEKVLIECCLELFRDKLVEGIQDLGAAGISCATSELASNGDGGMYIQLEKVLLRDPTLTAEEILMSESQERMMAVVTPEKLEGFLAMTAKWDVETSVLGEVTDTGRLVIDWNGEEIVNVDPRTVAIDGPVYDRPVAYPTWIDALQADSASALPRSTDAADLRAQFLSLLGSPNLADPSWITDQYDRYVLGNTALSFPDDAGMIRIDEESGLGFVIATDANGRYCQLDPYRGAQLALAEAYRNVAATGAVPVGISDCLNFGSPENPEVMWQFERAVTALADGCLELEIPVTGGNVSFYNQTGDQPIYPTPVVAVLGVIDDVARRVPSGWQDDGHNIYLLGITREELDGSAWADVVHGHLGGVPPVVDLPGEARLSGLLNAASIEALIDSAHDLSSGGLAQTLAEAVLRFGVGARVWLGDICERDGIDASVALFSESAGRVIVSVPREDDVKFLGLCEGRGYPVLRIGVTDNTLDALEVQDVFTVSLADLRSRHRSTLPAHFA